MRCPFATCLLLLTLAASPAIAGNNALDFDGTDDVASCGDPVGNEFDITGSATIEAWVRVSATPPPHLGGTVFTVVGKDQSSGTFPKWIFGLQNGGIAFHINGPTYGSGIWTYSTPFAQPLNTCYHVAVSKAANTYAFYLNGTAIGGGTKPQPLLDVPVPLTLGDSEPCCRYLGEIDEVRIWNVSRTSGDIVADMNVALSGSEPGLVAYYNMNQSGSSDVIDFGPNGFDCTRTGGSGANPQPLFVSSCAPVPVPTQAPLSGAWGYALLVVLLVAAGTLAIRTATGTNTRGQG